MVYFIARLKHGAKTEIFHRGPKINAAKAGICLKIVFTSLKTGADFKKCRQN
jgi:hypothetical protein